VEGDRVKTRFLVTAALAASTLVTAGAGARADAERVPKHKEFDPTRQVFWVDAEGGIESAHLETFHANFENLAVGVLPTDGVGPAVGVGTGVRLWLLTLGIRGRGAEFQSDMIGSWELWSLDAEIGIRFPLRRVEPYLTLAGGYTTTGGFQHAVAGLANGIDVYGANVRGGAGLDVFLSQTVSIGAQLTGEALMLTRDPVSVRDLLTAQQVGTLNEAKARVLQANGASVGTALDVTGGLGLHF
jgi:hypothetical protein